MSFSQQGPRTVCILSANGAISNVTLRQPATSGGLVTYEVHDYLEKGNRTVMLLYWSMYLVLSAML